MQSRSTTVALLHSYDYERKALKTVVDSLILATGFHPTPGARVLLKPNLVFGGRQDGLCCTHPEFVAAVAEWFLDYGAVVSVGDSPAFGTGVQVMKSCGIVAALEPLGVRICNFDTARSIRLPQGMSVLVADEALESDHLVNLPKVKAHGQLQTTLAVKNYFGTVLAWRKPWLHIRYGHDHSCFADIVTAIFDLLPSGISLVDGITAMHETGPISGTSYPLHLLASSTNPVAVDSTILTILGVTHETNPIWEACRLRNLPGTDTETLIYPKERPEDFLEGKDFMLPTLLQPIRFQLNQIISGSLRRLFLHCFFPGK